MDYENYIPPECDHDDVQCTHLFFDDTTSAHLARRRLRHLMQARSHWIVGVTPDCAPYVVCLNMLHHERCGEAMTIVGLRDLDCHPAMCVLPRDRGSLDDLVEAIQIEPHANTSIDEMPWILLTRGDTREISRAIRERIYKDNLLN
jgi:hypothetical protein